MDLREHARHALQFSRRLADGLIAELKSREDWLYQVHPQANHALWIVGHVGLADNSMARRFRPETARKPEGWDELFWSGSKPTSDSDRYPAEAEVLAYFRQRRENLLDVFADLSDDELQAPAPAAGERSPIAGAPCIGHLFLFAGQHEAMHMGQLTVANRGLGHPPLIGRPAPTPTA